MPTFGLVARYDLNGNAIDPIGGHNGANHGAILTSNRFQMEGTAYQFDGVDDFIEIADHDAFSISTTRKFSVSAWIRADTLTFTHFEAENYVYWMGKGQEYGTDNGDQEWAGRMYSFANPQNRTNRISFYVFSPAGGRGPGSYVQEPITIGEWMHYVATVDIDANKIIWYKNGELKDSDALIDDEFTAIPANGPAPVRFGTMNFFSFFKGAIDNVLFYNRILGPNEVKQLHLDQTP